MWSSAPTTNCDSLFAKEVEENSRKNKREPEKWRWSLHWTVQELMEKISVFLLDYPVVHGKEVCFHSTIQQSMKNMCIFIGLFSSRWKRDAFSELFEKLSRNQIVAVTVGGNSRVLGQSVKVP